MAWSMYGLLSVFVLGLDFLVLTSGISGVFFSSAFILRRTFLTLKSLSHNTEFLLYDGRRLCTRRPGLFHFLQMCWYQGHIGVSRSSGVQWHRTKVRLFVECQGMRNKRNIKWVENKPDIMSDVKMWFISKKNRSSYTVIHVLETQWSKLHLNFCIEENKMRFYLHTKRTTP
jgi:hypothetical protein